MRIWAPKLIRFRPLPLQTSNPVNPCQDEPFAPGVGGRGWWMHGNKDQPPEDGVYFEFPSGGRIHTELACNKVRPVRPAAAASRTDRLARVSQSR